MYFINESIINSLLTDEKLKNEFLQKEIIISCPKQKV